MAVPAPLLQARPKSHESLLRPTSFLAREVAADLTNNEPRFRALNVLSFDLDMPERTTADYEAQGVNPNVRHLPNISPTSLQHLPDISPTSPQDLPKIHWPTLTLQYWPPNSRCARRSRRL